MPTQLLECGENNPQSPCLLCLQMVNSLGGNLGFRDSPKVEFLHFLLLRIINKRSQDYRQSDRSDFPKARV